MVLVCDLVVCCRRRRRCHFSASVCVFATWFVGTFPLFSFSELSSLAPSQTKPKQPLRHDAKKWSICFSVCLSARSCLADFFVLDQCSSVQFSVWGLSLCSTQFVVECHSLFPSSKYSLPFLFSLEQCPLAIAVATSFCLCYWYVFLYVRLWERIRRRRRRLKCFLLLLLLLPYAHLSCAVNDDDDADADEAQSPSLHPPSLSYYSVAKLFFVTLSEFLEQWPIADEYSLSFCPRLSFL